MALGRVYRGFSVLFRVSLSFCVQLIELKDRGLDMPLDLVWAEAVSGDYLVLSWL